MDTLEEFMLSPEGQRLKRKHDEHDAHMRATSFTYRHFVAIFMCGFGLIITMLAGIAYFAVNGNALDHPEQFTLMMGFGFAGIFVILFAFQRSGGASRMQSILTPIAIMGGIGLLVAGIQALGY